MAEGKKRTMARRKMWTARECNLFPEDGVDSEGDERRRMRIVEELLGRDFNLAFRVLYEFRWVHMQGVYFVRFEKALNFLSCCGSICAGVECSGSW